MQDQEIYDLAYDVLGTLSRELGEGIYREIGGDLSLKWSAERKFGASASASNDASGAPEHSVTIHYELVRQIWRDAEEFCSFMRTIPENSGVDNLYEFYGSREKLPACFSAEQQVKNLFVAAITWVYFHEIGHLMQEHGHIRAQFGLGAVQVSSEIHDMEAQAEDVELTEEQSIVSHTTELAADFEATYFYLLELVRHITDTDFVEEERKGIVTNGLVYLMICGLSMVFLRFNGILPIAPTSKHQRSHPNPIVRLEINVSHIYELLDSAEFRNVTGHGLSRAELVALSGKAALSATLFWTMTKTEGRKVDSRFLIKGILSNLAVLQYLAPILKCWDEMLPEVKKVRRFGSEFGLMTFAPSFRERIVKGIPWGEGPEKLQA